MPITQLAYIDEASCVGCTRCIDACPVDAIVGSEQYLHTVIVKECIGCALCVPACPVDCIQLVHAPEDFKEKSKTKIKQCVATKKHRLETIQQTLIPLVNNIQQKKAYLKAAILRVKNKKQKNMGEGK